MAITILMPALSPTMEEGALTKWTVKVGDRVSSGDVIAEIETDKATMEVEAVDDGVVEALLVDEGAQSVKINTPIAVLREAEEESRAEATAPVNGSTRSAYDPRPRQSPDAARTPGAARVFASPLARRLAADRGVDVAALTGSGPGGRIVEADLDRAASPPPAATAAPAPAWQPMATPEATSRSVRSLYADRAFSEAPVDSMREAIAARLTEAKQTIPHFYLRREVELDRLLAVRAELNQLAEHRSVKLSLTDFIVRACALALQQTPDCNAVWAGDAILRFKASDVALAVAVKGGLYTPVLRDAEAKPLATLSAEIRELAARARDRRLAPHQYQGGAFAISNLGMFGVESFDAVINPPHASILAVGAAVRRPVARGDRIEVATLMSLTLSLDHRVIDGALGAAFLDAITRHLNAPLGLLV